MHGPRPRGRWAVASTICDPSYQETGAAIAERYVQRLKKLADAHGIAWRYAPLHHFLTHPEDAGAEV